MNLILRNKTTWQYVETDGRWTVEHGRARVFRSGLEAVLFCLENDIHNMEILGEFRDQRLNFAVPVTDSRSSRSTDDSSPTV